MATSTSCCTTGDKKKDEFGRCKKFIYSECFFVGVVNDSVIVLAIVLKNVLNSFALILLSIGLQVLLNSWLISFHESLGLSNELIKRSLCAEVLALLISFL